MTISNSIMYHYVDHKRLQCPFSTHYDYDQFMSEVNALLEGGHQFMTVTERFYSKCDEAIALTFDDGLKCHLKVAESLRSLNIAATFYPLSRPLIDKVTLNVHLIHLIVFRYGSKSLELLRKSCIEQDIDYHSLESRVKTSFQDIYRRYDDTYKVKLFKKICNFADMHLVINKLLTHICDSKGIPYSSESVYLIDDELRKISEMGHEIGSHGHSHTPVGMSSRTMQKIEVKVSCDHLSAIIGKPIKSYCFPYGTFETISKSIEPIFEQVGITNAVMSCDNQKALAHGHQLRYALSRVDCIDYDFSK